MRCYNLQLIVKIMRDSLEVHKKSSNKSSLVPPLFDISDPVPIWTQRCHYEQIKSLEYIQEEKLLLTTAFDKKVKLWDSSTGQLKDTFQQNYDKRDPRPIAFKRSGTEEIYDPSLEHRIDLKFTQESSKQKNKQVVSSMAKTS